MFPRLPAEHSRGNSRTAQIYLSINFATWRKANWQLIKPENRARWDALDVLAKRLIAARSAGTFVNVCSCVIGGLLNLGLIMDAVLHVS